MSDISTRQYTTFGTLHDQPGIPVYKYEHIGRVNFSYYTLAELRAIIWGKFVLRIAPPCFGRTLSYSTVE